MRFPGLASAALLLIILSVLSVFAQTSTGEVNGTITDPNGGSVPGAAVKLINQATDIETGKGVGDGSAVAAAHLHSSW